MITEIYKIGRVGEGELKMWTVSAKADHIPTYNHRHADFEISTVLSGKGVYDIGETKVEFENGDVFVFASNEPHFISRICDEGLELLNLHFTPDLINSRGFNALSINDANFCYAHSPEFQNRIPKEIGKLIREQMQAMFTEMREMRKEYVFAVKMYLCSILLTLIRDHDYSSKSVCIHQLTVSKLAKAVAYIDLHFTEHLPICDLAAISGMAVNYFSTLFKKVYNITPNEYIISRRLEMSARYLDEEPDTNILDIAVRCGFNNTANFDKLFKKHYGITPVKYRNMPKY